MKIHTALILAGGDGDRFAPLQEKTRFRFNGESLLHLVARSVQEYVEKIVIVSNENNIVGLRDDLKDIAATWVTQKNNAGGMADAVLAAEAQLKGEAIIFNGNDLIDFALIPQLVNQTKEEGTLLGFVAKRIEKYFPSGYVRFAEGKAVEIIEKPLPADVPSEYVRLVMDYFPNVSVFISELKALGATDDQYERAMSAVMKQKPATCIKSESDWATIKYSWHILAIQEYVFQHFLKTNIDSSVVMHKTSTIEGTVSVGKNVKIGAYVKITGPCYIGDNVVIGDHSLIRSSTIENNVLVGSGCEVARSYLAQGVMLHRNYVGDSVLSEGVTMGAGAVTANYRFDAQTVKTPIKGKMVDSTRGKFGLIAGKEVKIGVNVSTYPGVKLAPKTMILPGETVTKDK